MNKHGWTYKKLGEVAKMYQPKTLSTQQLVENGRYLVYGANGVIGRYTEYNHEESEILMTCRGATCGSINVSEPKSWINGNAMVIHPLDNNEFSRSYLAYCLLAADKTKIITGLAQPQITRQNLKELIVPIPSIGEQEAIVAELDEINEAIAALQQQVADLDTLAQSTFYTMFGEPEKNPFGFSTYPLSELCLLKAGKAIKANQLSDKKENRYPCYGGNGVRGFIETYSHSGIYPIIGRQGALCGNINLAQGKFYATEHAVVASPIKEMNALWLYFALQFMHLEKYAHGVAQPGLSVKDLNPLIMYYPALALQQEFAEKVEAIESAKAEINAQIAEMQTLLASRMDYYFD